MHLGRRIGRDYGGGSGYENPEEDDADADRRAPRPAEFSERLAQRV